MRGLAGHKATRSTSARPPRPHGLFFRTLCAAAPSYFTGKSQAPCPPAIAWARTGGITGRATGIVVCVVSCQHGITLTLLLASDLPATIEELLSLPLLLSSPRLSIAVQLDGISHASVAYTSHLVGSADGLSSGLPSKRSRQNPKYILPTGHLGAKKKRFIGTDNTEYEERNEPANKLKSRILHIDSHRQKAHHRISRLLPGPGQTLLS